MKYDFDRVIDRSNTGAIKVERMKELYHRDDILPMWIADMDFAAPDYILNALKQRLDHPIIGYTQRNEDWYRSIIRWQKVQHGWDIRKEWLSFIPGIVPGIAFAIQCFTKPGDKILIQTPVYPPYINVPTNNGREIVEVPFSIDDTLHMDMSLFAEKARGCKLFLLCHPHNPGGKVWSREELVEMAEICKREGVIVVSDEIHADLTLPGHTHLPFAEVSQAANDISITFGSPSKAFNIAGLVSSYAVVPNDDLRQQFFEYLEDNELTLGHLLAFIGVAAAYSNGTQWLEECLSYIQGNINLLREALEDVPGIKLIEPQASYLVLLDCREMMLTPEELNDFFISKAGIMLNNGIEFGTQGKGFMRMNIAVPRSVLEEAILRIKKATKT